LASSAAICDALFGGSKGRDVRIRLGVETPLEAVLLAGLGNAPVASSIGRPWKPPEPCDSDRDRWVSIISSTFLAAYFSAARETEVLAWDLAPTTLPLPLSLFFFSKNCCHLLSEAEPLGVPPVELLGVLATELAPASEPVDLRLLLLLDTTAFMAIDSKKAAFEPPISSEITLLTSLLLDLGLDLERDRRERGVVSVPIVVSSSSKIASGRPQRAGGANRIAALRGEAPFSEFFAE
jgi:hypothetical protein